MGFSTDNFTRINKKKEKNNSILVSNDVINRPLEVKHLFWKAVVIGS